jgi:hypothetical protein
VAPGSDSAPGAPPGTSPHQKAHTKKRLDRRPVDPYLPPRSFPNKGLGSTTPWESGATHLHSQASLILRTHTHTHAQDPHPPFLRQCLHGDRAWSQARQQPPPSPSYSSSSRPPWRRPLRLRPSCCGLGRPGRTGERQAVPCCQGGEGARHHSRPARGQRKGSAHAHF